MRTLTQFEVQVVHGQAGIEALLAVIFEIVVIGEFEKIFQDLDKILGLLIPAYHRMD